MYNVQRIHGQPSKPKPQATTGVTGNQPTTVRKETSISHQNHTLVLSLLIELDKDNNNQNNSSDSLTTWLVFKEKPAKIAGVLRYIPKTQQQAKPSLAGLFKIHSVH